MITVQKCADSRRLGPWLGEISGGGFEKDGGEIDLTACGLGPAADYVNQHSAADVRSVGFGVCAAAGVFFLYTCSNS